MSKGSIAFILPHWQKLEYLERTIPALLGQMLEDDELIISCDGDLNEVDAKIKELEISDPRLKCIGFSKKVGYMAATVRNLGANEATAERLWFLDPDCLVREGFRAVLDMWLEPGKFCLGKITLERADKTHMEDPRAGLMFRGGNHVSMFCWGGSWGCYRDEYHLFGGHNEAFNGGWGPLDFDTALSAILSGLQVRYLGSAEVLHLYHSKTEMFISASDGILYRNRGLFFSRLYANWETVKDAQIFYFG